MSADTLVPTATPEVVSSLVAALDDADWHVYHAVREALAEVGAPAVTPLIKKLAAPDVRSRYMAQQALAEIGGDAVGQLLGSLRDERGEIRHWARLGRTSLGRRRGYSKIWPNPLRRGRQRRGHLVTPARQRRPKR